MTFDQMNYERPDLERTAEAIEKLTDSTKKAADGDTLLNDYRHFVDEVETARTAGTLASIRHTVDTRDTFYSDENDYFDHAWPVLGEKMLDFYRAILASDKKEALAQKYGNILLEKMEISVRSSDERLIDLQQKENALTTDYERLYAGARIDFQGKELTVAQLGPYKQSAKRSLRKEAFEAEGGFFDAHRTELDELYEKLVKNRTEQAKLMGYDSYTPLGDIRMRRHGYDRGDIAACREEVIRGVVPVANKIKQGQAARIGIDDFKMYDASLGFKDGNPKPHGTPDEILAAGQTMYRELSPQTAEFIDFMMARDLFDVLAKPGKAPGGYCTFIADYESPFIFSNFNGTAGDVDVLTHEAGHAFAAFVAAQKELTMELRSPGLESCEIHSMSMEFLTQDYHHLFFGDDTDKYELSHAEDALTFLPYGCQVDEFQHTVYDNPSLTADERNALWLELEAKYRPWMDFDGLPFYGRGAGWQRQLHIYTSPFYYIDYVLAQAVALQFFLAAEKDAADAWARYMALVEKGGTETYPGLVKAAGMQTPFEAGVMERVSNEVYQWMQTHPLFTV